MKRSSVPRLIWSASTWCGCFQPRSRTAASAAVRTLAGSDPTMPCSRFDLFHTGTTCTPCSAPRIHARSCALAWWAKRSPTPMESFSSFNIVWTRTALLLLRGGALCRELVDLLDLVLHVGEVGRRRREFHVVAQPVERALVFLTLRQKNPKKLEILRQGMPRVQPLGFEGALFRGPTILQVVIGDRVVEVRLRIGERIQFHRRGSEFGHLLPLLRLQLEHRHIEVGQDVLRIGLHRVVERGARAFLIAFTLPDPAQLIPGRRIFWI